MLIQFKQRNRIISHNRIPQCPAALRCRPTLHANSTAYCILSSCRGLDVYCSALGYFNTLGNFVSPKKFSILSISFLQRCTINLHVKWVTWRKKDILIISRLSRKIIYYQTIAISCSTNRLYEKCLNAKRAKGWPNIFRRRHSSRDFGHRKMPEAFFWKMINFSKIVRKNVRRICSPFVYYTNLVIHVFKSS